MAGRASRIWVLAVAAAGAACGVLRSDAIAAQQPAAQNTVRQVGTIKAISGNTITLSPDAGGEFRIVVQETTKLARIEPGATDLKNAVAMKLSELQVGDRILVRGTAGDDPKTVHATLLIAMKHEDIQALRQKEREDWQRRGAGGLVSSVDATTGSVKVDASSLAGKREIVVHTTKDTIVRRYAPDSVKFDDAKPAKLGDIKPGDQLRARGNRSADGNEIAAEEIVAGTFRNIAGTVSAIDIAASTITVNDLATKKPVVVKITAESQMRKLPPALATGIAMRLKAASGEAPQGGAGGGGQGGGAAGGGQRPPGGGAGAGSGGGRGDFQTMLNRLPAATLADLQKGDAVMIVTTEGTTATGVTAVTLLAGVEPILTASGGQGMNLSPWTIGAGAPEGAGTP